MKNFTKILLVVVLFFTVSCGDTQTTTNNNTNNQTSNRTPKGVTLVGTYTDAQKQVIDEALTQVFKDAKAEGYVDHPVLTHNYYTVQQPPQPCVPSPVSGIPSFKVRGDNYDGTEYDQYNPKGVGVKDGVGYVLAAEQVNSFTPKGTMTVCIDDSVLSNGVRHGAEHILLKPLDPSYYSQTETHLTKGHPLLPKTQAKGLKAQKVINMDVVK